MQPLFFLRSLARALVRHGGNALGLGIAGDVLLSVGDDVWQEWARDRSEPQRRDELEAVTRAAPAASDSAVAEVVREVASDRPRDAQERLSACLRSVPDLLRASLRRPADPAGLSVPPNLPLRSAADLVALLVRRQPPRETLCEPSSSPRDGPTVTLVPIKGVLCGTPLVFRERTVVIVGKEAGCLIRLPDDDAHQYVSRHHCLLDITPPAVRVRDLASKNGTFVNASRIEYKEAQEQPGQANSSERDLQHGDVFHLAKSAVAAFRVEINSPPRCSLCSALIPSGQVASCERAPSIYECAACRARVTAAEPATNSKQTAVGRRDICPHCNRSSPEGTVCADCRRDLAALTGSLLDQARAGPEELAAVCGYQLGRELNRGGMGVVYLAHHDTGREVALKVMLPALAADDHAIRRFLREGNVLRSLRSVKQHAHVVRLFDAGYFRGVFFITQEFCGGGSVANLLRTRGGTLPVDEAIEITIQALAGLAHVHTSIPGHPIVHRDVKPGNVLLHGSGSERRAKVADFGLAKMLDDAGLSSITGTGTRAGSPWYMPRQQVVSFKEADPAVDVWALAATLYHLLTGTVPRDFPKDKDPWLVVLEHDPVPIRRRQPSIPPRLAEVIDHALQEKPAIGFQSAAAFAEAVEDAV